MCMQLRVPRIRWSNTTMDNVSYQQPFHNSADQVGSSNSVHGLENRLASLIQNQMSDVHKRFDQIQNQLHGFENDLSEAKNGVLEVQIQVKEAWNVIRMLENKVDDLENRSRRNNCLIFGIDDSKTETWDESEEVAKDFFINKL